MSHTIVKRPTIVGAIAFAAGVAMASSCASTLLTAVAPLTNWNPALWCCAATAYALYLLGYSAKRAGRVLILFVGCASTVATIWLDTSSFRVLAVSALVFLAVRLLTMHRRFLTLIVDAALCAFSVSLAALYLSHGEGIGSTMWIYFLLQSAVFVLPRSTWKPSERVSAASDSGSEFDVAHAAAERAFQRLLGMA